MFSIQNRHLPDFFNALVWFLHTPQCGNPTACRRPVYNGVGVVKGHDRFGAPGAGINSVEEPVADAEAEASQPRSNSSSGL
jgi:hypothetical protein